jgi:hypothetical protein
MRTGRARAAARGKRKERMTISLERGASLALSLF